jgi:hypothetical protein
MKNIVKQFTITVALSFTLFLFMSFDPYTCEAGWKKKNLGGGGMYNSIALDPSGNPHISYLDDSNPLEYVLRHGFSDGHVWKTEVVDSGDVGWYSSMKIDSLDHIHVSYHADKPAPSLKYAFFDGTTWSSNTIEGGGYSTSIAVDENNRPHISHITAGGQINYVYHNGTVWMSETIAENALSFGATSLALTPSGTAYITFSDSSIPRQLYLATNVSGSWEVTYLADGRQSSLALDALDRPHIVYFAEDASELRYTRYNGSSWITESESILADSPSIALDKLDRPHISFGASLGGPDVLIYYYHNGQEWLFKPLQIKSGYSTSITLNAQGLAHIASSKLIGSRSSLGYFHYLGVRLKVSKTGKGSGTVTSVPEGISCGSTCKVNYLPETSITLAAEPDTPGSTFAGWTKCPSPSGNQCTIVVEKNSTVKAKFDKVSP